MSEQYNPQAIELKWRQRWEDEDLYRTPDKDSRPKFYFLTMYPYPSGDLHTGHWYAFAVPVARGRPWTGARPVTQLWPASRCGVRIASASAVVHPSRNETSLNGSSA